jgi:lipopolysaccharide export system protein LptA
VRKFKNSIGLFVFVFLTNLCPIVFAQQTKMIEILNANSLEFDENLGVDAKRLIGDVKFKHENAIMFCDSAYYYSNNKLDAFGNVHIVEGDSVHLYGDFLKYDGNTKNAEVIDNVRMNDKQMKLTTKRVFYDLTNGIAFYDQKGKIINDKNTLTSDFGYYYSKDKNLFFKKNVVLVNPDYTINSDTLKYNTVSEISYFLGPTTINGKEEKIFCKNGWYDSKKDISRFSKEAILQNKNQQIKGDSLYYDKGNSYGKAIGNVTITDTTEKIILKGEITEMFQELDYSYITKNALLIQYDKSDTLFLTADTLKATYDSTYFAEKTKFNLTQKPTVKSEKKIKNKKESNTIIENKSEKVKFNKDSLAENHRMILAYRKVKFFRKDLQGKCDSLAYVSNDSLMKMFNKPVLWSDENQLTAQFIKIKISDGKVYQLQMTENSFIISKEDSLRFNQIKGKNMTGLFSENELYKIDVFGNGESVYFAKDDEDGSYIGVNKAICTNISISIKEKKVDKITMKNSPDAAMYPIKELPPQELILKDFIWRGAERPINQTDIVGKK